MKMRASRLSCGFLLVLTLSSAAEDKDRERLHQQAVDAGQHGRTRQARDLACKLARQRPSDNSAKQDCNVWANELQAELAHYDDEFTSARALLKESDCDGAELNFSHVVAGAGALEGANVLTGSHVKEARAALEDDVPSCFYERGMKNLRMGRYDAAADSFARVLSGSHGSQAQAAIREEIPAARIADDTFHIAEKAFSSGRIEESEKLFRAITAGQYTDEARDYTEKRIPKWYADRGEEAFRENSDDSLARAEHYFQLVCCSPYLEDAAMYLRERIPRARKDRAEKKQFEHAEKAYGANDFKTAQGLFSRFVTDPEDNFASRAAMYLNDIEKYQDSMDCGNRNKQAKCARARECFNAAATIKRDGPGNPSALLQNLACAPPTQPPSSDSLLAEAVNEFQARQYNEAEVHLRDYLAQKESRTPDKLARARFYLGASKASRYYLDPRSEQLLQEARTDLCMALRSNGFTVSKSEIDFVSPRIMDAYRNSCR
jgi:hypothetical protein